MPDISNEISAFQNAVYGKDVREAIVDLAEKLNDDLDDALTHELSTVDATLTQSGAGADAKVVGERFADLEDAVDNIEIQIPNVDRLLETSGDAADAYVVGAHFSEDRRRLTALEGTTSTHTSQIGTINTTLANKADNSTVAAKLNISDVDSALSGTSTHPVQNKVVKSAVDALDGRVSASESTIPTLATKAELSAAETALDGRLDPVEATLPTLATKSELTAAETAISARLDAVEDELPTKISDLEDDKGLLVVGHDLEIQSLQIGDCDVSGSFFHWLHTFSSSAALGTFWSALVNEQSNICFIKRGGAKLPLVYDADNEIFYFNARTDHSRVDARQSYVHIQKTDARAVTFYFDEDRSDDTLSFVAAKVRYLTANDGVAKTADLADVATSGDYADLSNTPTIPSKASDLINDRGYLNETTAEQKGFLRNKTVEETETIGNAALESLGQLTDADGYPVFYGWYATSSTRTWPAALWSALVSASSDGAVYYEDSNGDLKPLTYDSANSRFSYNLNSSTAGMPAANELHRSVSNKPGILIYYVPDDGESDQMHIYLTDDRSNQRIIFDSVKTYEDNYMKETLVDQVTGTKYKIVVRNGQISLTAV